VTGVTNFLFKWSKVGLWFAALGGRPHNMSALDGHVFSSIIVCFVHHYTAWQPWHLLIELKCEIMILFLL